MENPPRRTDIPKPESRRLGGSEPPTWSQTIPDEAHQPAPDFASIGSLAPADLIARYAVGVENLDRRVLEAPDEALDTAFLPDAGVGRWPARVLVGHLADAEMVLVHRMRRTVAEDNPVLAIMDEDAFIDAALYGGPGDGPRHPPAAFVAVIHTLRRWTAGWLGTLQPEQFERRAMHPQRGEVTVHGLLAYDTWHLEHHAWFLKRKLDRLGIPQRA